jgi:hypothetical protein
MGRYSKEFRERAVRLATEAMDKHSSRWPAQRVPIDCEWVGDRMLRNTQRKIEVIRRCGPWRKVDEVEYAVLEWVDWFNNRRLLEPVGYATPSNFEKAYHRNTIKRSRGGCTDLNTSLENPGRFILLHVQELVYPASALLV